MDGRSHAKGSILQLARLLGGATVCMTVRVGHYLAFRQCIL
jgi:hypothetical protein